MTKLEVFEKFLTLISLLCQSLVAHQNSLHHEPSVKPDQLYQYKYKLHFFYKAIIDEIYVGHVRNILIQMCRVGFCRHSQNNDMVRHRRRSQQLGARFVDHVT